MNSKPAARAPAGPGSHMPVSTAAAATAIRMEFALDKRIGAVLTTVVKAGHADDNRVGHTE